MPEVTRKILAYQRGPLILFCQDAGSIPDQFLASLRVEEKQYLAQRTNPGLLSVVEELLPVLGAACASPLTSPLLVNALSEPIHVSDTIDNIFFTLAADTSTKRWLTDEIGNAVRSDLKKLVQKTQQRFGHAQLVVISVLPQFIDAQPVSDELVCFGDKVLEDASPSPIRLASICEPRVLSSLCEHWSFIGVHPKFFRSESLQKQLVEKLSELKVSVVAQ